jgi:P27 family predicted phage terminase small subunit
MGLQGTVPMSLATPRGIPQAKIYSPRADTGAGHSFVRNGVLSLKNSGPAPPRHLSQEARKFWRKIAEEYVIDDDAGLVVLTVAFEAFDRMRDAQGQITKDGTTIIDRFGQVKMHPLLPVERDARAQSLAGIKALNLDLEPLADSPGRPPGGFKPPNRHRGEP